MVGRIADIFLNGEIAEAVNGAVLRGPAFVLGYVSADATPSLSFRGSLLVYSDDQLALWARNPVDGLARSVAERPPVSLVYYSRDTPGPFYLSIKGRARVAPELNDFVYEHMVEVERTQDPERHGVAIVIDVDDVVGASTQGMFLQERTP